MRLSDFQEIWCVDFEFHQMPGGRPTPICVTGYEIRSGQWIQEFEPSSSPFPINDSSTVFVGYALSAEWGCYLAYGWPLPPNKIDLFAEFRLHTNSIDGDDRRVNSLLAAAAYFKIPHIESEMKDRMRALAARGGPWTEEEKCSLLAYNKSDVQTAAAIFRKLVGNYSSEEFDQALIRGRYTAAIAHIEHIGVPIDVDTLSALRERWEDILLALIEQVDRDFHVYDGVHFKFDLFANLLKRRGIAWPITQGGRLRSDDDTFGAMAVSYPFLQPLKQLRATLGSLKLESLSVGRDGRNRTQLKPFMTVTGRNAPSNSQYVFGPATWIRFLIMPEPGTALCYLDFAQQEFAVAAVLSQDENMLAAYKTGDVYLAFAQQAGAVPPEATKQTHSAVRDLYKMVVLALQYGMTERSLSVRIGRSENEAARLILKHRQTYPRFWQWKDRILAHLQLERSYSTPSGWRVMQQGKLNEHQRRSVVNFPVQATAADMFRLACCLGTEAGIRICAPVHDAVLFECSLDELSEQVSLMQSLMARASREILNGFEIRTEAKIFTGRFSDPRGESTWRIVNDLLTRPARPASKQFEFFKQEEVSHSYGRLH